MESSAPIFSGDFAFTSSESFRSAGSISGLAHPASSGMASKSTQHILSSYSASLMPMILSSASFTAPRMVHFEPQLISPSPASSVAIPMQSCRRSYQYGFAHTMAFDSAYGFMLAERELSDTDAALASQISL